MKLTAVLLFIACLHATARTDAQTVTLSVKDAPLKQVFKEIQKQTGMNILAEESVFESANKVTLTVRNMPVNDVLALCFKDEPLSFTITGGAIIVKEKTVEQKNILEQFFPPPPIDVHGRVVNEKGEAVPGVTVTVKGTKNATSTDVNGYFEIKDIDEKATLVFTSTNMESFQIKVEGKTDLAISLKTKVTALGDVTVQVSNGYQTIPKERATGSFAQPDKEMYNARVSTDIISKLNGITSGLVFNTGISAAPPITIRGRSTILANTSPLIVVDNFAYDGDINNINPNDIENITILKDAAAASIWGVRAGNGVIVVTTKKGKFNQPLKVELNSNITIGKKPNLFYNRNFLNSSDFIDLEQFLYSKGYYTSDLSNATTYVPVSPAVEIFAKQASGQLSASDATTQINALKQFDVRNDLSRFFYQQSLNQQYALNMNGGTSNANYLFSIGYDNDLSNTVGNQNNRITINGVTGFAPQKNVEITCGINYIQGNTASNSTLSDVVTGGPSGKSIYPYATFVDSSGNALPIVKDYRASFVQSAPSKGLQNWQYYPTTELGLADNTTQAFDVRILTGLKYSIYKGLSFEVKYQYEKGNSLNRVYYNPQTYYDRNLINKYSVVTSGVRTGYNITLGGDLYLYNSAFTSNNGRAQINYNYTSDKHSVNALVGFDIKQATTDINNNGYYGYNNDNEVYANINYSTSYSLYPSGFAAINNQGLLGGTTNRFRSWFANSSYSFENKYTVSLSGRIDQTNLFGVKTNQKTTPLWSTGFKWDINKERFYNISWLPDLRLRATYGINGNTLQNGSAYTTVSYNSVSSPIQPPYAIVGTSGNPSLTWEKIAMGNIGLDFATKKNIIAGSIEYFFKRGTNIIGQNAIPSSTGFTSVSENYADMQGQGFDVIISSKNIDKKIKWNSSLLLSYATDKVTNYTGSATGGLLVGKPVQSIYSYKWAGLDPNSGDPIGYLNDTLSKNYSALANQPTAQQKYNGPATPTLFGGLRNSFAWDRFSISFNISFKFGYFFKRSSINYTNLLTTWRGNADYQQRWQKPGDEKITNVPSLVFPANTSRDAFYNGSEAIVEKGDHIRFQDISFSYEFDTNKWKSHPIKTLQAYIYLNNIGILWRANQYKIDPDFQNGYYNPQTASVGIKARF